MQKMFQYFGSGSNGKSLLINFIKSCVGSYGSTVSNTFLSTVLTQYNSDLVKCRTKKLIFLSEPQGEKDEIIMNVEFFKNITGDEIISTRNLFKNQIEFKPNFNIICLTNQLFTIPNMGHSIQRRMELIPFNTQFVSEKDYNINDSNMKIMDINLEKKLNSDRLKITFLKMLFKEAHLIKDTRNNIYIPKDCKEATSDYINEQNIIKPWLDLYLIKNDKKNNIKIKELRLHYNSTLDNIKNEIKHDTKFLNLLKFNKIKTVKIDGYYYCQGYDMKDIEI